jgi:hypothetical protein
LSTQAFPNAILRNRKRFIRSINAFWERDIAERRPPIVEDESLVENWGPKRNPRQLSEPAFEVRLGETDFDQ